MVRERGLQPAGAEALEPWACRIEIVALRMGYPPNKRTLPNSQWQKNPAPYAEQINAAIFGSEIQVEDCH